MNRPCPPMQLADAEGYLAGLKSDGIHSDPFFDVPILSLVWRRAYTRAEATVKERSKVLT